MKPIIAPSILAANFANLQQEIEMINQSEGDWIHVDIMDGSFVPTISFGIPICQAVKRHATKPLDVHLMVENPGKHIKSFKDAGADHLTIHYEACSHVHREIEKIKKLDCKAGVAINPHTNVQLLTDVIHLLDIVIIMSVNPGYGGQEFILNTYQKIIALKELIDQKNTKTLIEIDGGVNENNAKTILDHGADVLVAGSFVFNSSDPINTIKGLKNVYTVV